MKKIVFVGITALSLMSFMKNDTAKTWTVDNVHSKIGFAITHLGINDVQGFFSKFDAKVVATKSDFSDASFELNADVASVTTGFEGLDNHLKAPDMFDATATPKFIFKSTSVASKGGKNLEVKGDLTLHGVTKAITLDAIYNGQVSQNNKTVAGFKLTGKINRKDFKVGTELPDMVASDLVTINANVEFVQN